MDREVVVSSVNEEGEIEEVVEPLDQKAEEPAKPAAEAEPKPPEEAKPADKPEGAAPAGEKPAGGEETPEEKAAKEAASKAAEKSRPEEKSRARRAIDKLTAEKQWLEDRVAELTAKGREGTQEVEAAAEPEDKQPQDVDFETTEEFITALGKWSARQEFNELRAQEAQQVQDQQRKEIYDAYNQQVAKAHEAHDDFEEVVGQNIELPQSVQLIIIELDNGAEVAYHLGKNPELCKKLMDLTPLKAVAEIGRVSASLIEPGQQAGKVPALSAEQKTAKSSFPAKQASNAPAPIEPVEVGVTKTHVPLDDPSVSHAEYMRRRDLGET